jgi:hypothetical protein
MRNFNSDKAVHRFECVINDVVDRNSAVGIVTRYGLDGPGSNPGWSKFFRTHPDGPWGPPSLLLSRNLVFPGSKAAGVWR